MKGGGSSKEGSGTFLSNTNCQGIENPLPIAMYFYQVHFITIKKYLQILKIFTIVLL